MVMTSSQDEIFVEISRMLEAYRKGPAPITGETDIARDLNLDSLAVMDLMMELEEKFDISIPLNLVPEIQTVDDLTATIRKIRGDA